MTHLKFWQTCSCPRCTYIRETVMADGAEDLHEDDADNAPHPKRVTEEHVSAVNIFDREVETITQRRGEIYAHPSVDFQKIATLKAALPHFEDARLKHIAEMICVKIVRLSNTPHHLDSIVDIAGYARTWAMVLDAETSGIMASA